MIKKEPEITKESEHESGNIFKMAREVLDAQEEPHADEDHNSAESLEEVLQICRDLNWDEKATHEAFKIFQGNFTVELFLRAGEASDWRVIVVFESLTRLNENISTEQFFEIAEKCNWNEACIYLLLKQLDGLISKDQFFEIALNTKWNSEVVVEALFKISENFSFDQIVEVTKNTNWKNIIVRRAFDRLEKPLSIDQFYEIAEMSGWNEIVFIKAFESIKERLTFDQFFQIAEKTEWHYNITLHGIKYLIDSLSFEQLLTITERSNWYDLIIKEAFEKLDHPLSFDQLLLLCKTSSWDYRLLIKAFEEFPSFLSFDQVMEISKESNWYNKLVDEAFKKMDYAVSLADAFVISNNAAWKDHVVLMAFERIEQRIPLKIVLKLIAKQTVSEDTLERVIIAFIQKNSVSITDYQELSDELLSHKRYDLLLKNLDRFKNLDTLAIATKFINDVGHSRIIEFLSYFPPETYKDIIEQLLNIDNLDKYSLTKLLPYIDLLDEKERENFIEKVYDSMPESDLFSPELLERGIKRAIFEFRSLSIEDQKIKLQQLIEAKYYKPILILIKEFSYLIEIVELSYDDILKELETLSVRSNFEHLSDLISIGIILYPEKTNELENIRKVNLNQTTPEQLKSPAEPRERFLNFDTLKEIFDYYIMVSLSRKYPLPILSEEISSKVSERINVLYEKMKEYIIIAVSSELDESRTFRKLEPGIRSNFLYKFGSPEQIKIFFERAKATFVNKSEFRGNQFAGKSWATISDFGEQFWMPENQEDTDAKIALLNMAVSLQHNTGYFFDKDNRVKLDNLRLKEFLDFEAGGNQTFETFLEYGLANRVISREEYDEYSKLNQELADNASQLPTIDKNRVLFNEQRKDANRQIEIIQNNPNLPLEIKMEAQAVFDKTRGIKETDNYRFYLSRLLKTISVDWEVLEENIKVYKSGEHTIYNISIAGYDLSYWYENGKLITFNSMNELRSQKEKLSKVLNKPIVEAQFGYLREGD